MNTFYLRVISSNKIFFEGRVEKIVLPLEDGEKAVLAHHENMVIATSIGEIRITTSKGELVGVVGEGFVQIVNNRVVLIVDSAEKPEDIDRVRAKEAKIRAEERLRQKESLKEYKQSEASLARALTRLRVTEKI
ncbi:MAG: ATP synthase F1 subunit epsilon [Clostridiales bacterium]|nr:ATP synthase F1 subunit epsilon [Clostridiales bacterium]